MGYQLVELSTVQESSLSVSSLDASFSSYAQKIELVVNCNCLGVCHYGECLRPVVVWAAA